MRILRMLAYKVFALCLICRRSDACAAWLGECLMLKFGIHSNYDVYVFKIVSILYVDYLLAKLAV